MTNAELTELNSKRRIHQLGFLVYDIEKSMDKWINLFNVGPWTVLELNSENCRNCIENGEPSNKEFKFACAVTKFGDIQIELIQPFYGVSIYEEYMKKHGESMHHFKEYIPDEKIDDAVKEYTDKGLRVIRQGHYLADIHVYIDTLDDLGFQLELGNCPDLELTEDMYYIYPCE